MGGKEGVLCPVRGELGPRLLQCGLGRGLHPYQVAFSSIQPFGDKRHEPKTEGCALLGESCDPIKHNVAWADIYLRTKWHLDPCSRLATIDMGQKIGWRWVWPSFWGKLDPHRTQSPWAEAYLHTKWHLSPFSHLPKIGGCAP